MMPAPTSTTSILAGSGTGGLSCSAGRLPLPGYRGAGCYRPDFREPEGGDPVRKYGERSEGTTGRITEISVDSDYLRLSVMRGTSTGTGELGIQFGSGGDSTEAELAAEGKKDIGDLVDRAKKAIDAHHQPCTHNHWRLKIYTSSNCNI
jgi:hypothetical protein